MCHDPVSIPVAKPRSWRTIQNTIITLDENRENILVSTTKIRNLTLRDLEEAHEALGHAIHSMRSGLNMDLESKVADLIEVPGVSTDEMLGIVSVIKHRSFTKAAVALGMSQPGLSRQVQRFEKAMNRTVLSRTGHGVEVTPQGIEAIAWATSTLEGLVQLGAD